MATETIHEGVEPQDEFVHLDYPRDLKQSWKENYYFNYVDQDSNAWGLFHVSIMRLEQKALLRNYQVIDGKHYTYVNRIDIDGDFSEITDGKLTFEIVKPLQQLQVTFKDDELEFELVYVARYEAFDYAGHRKNREATGKHKGLNIRHYEQGMTVKGTLVKDGETRSIDCLGHRDHSWGYRNERIVDGGWNWIAVQLPGATINASQVRLGGRKMNAGFVSTAEGNVRIKSLEVHDTFNRDDGVPQGSTFVATDVEGKVWTLHSRGFSYINIPINPEDPDCSSRALDNYSEITLEETGESGSGIDEYMFPVWPVAD